MQTHLAPTTTHPVAFSSNKQHLSTDFGQSEEFRDMLIVEPDAPIRRPPSALARVVRAVNAVIGPAWVERMGAERSGRAWADLGRPFGVTLEHRRGGAPARAFDLAHDRGAAPAREILGQWHGRGVQLVHTLILAPIVDRAGVDIYEDRPVAQIRKIRLPIQRAEGRDIAAHGSGDVSFVFDGIRTIHTLRDRRRANHSAASSQKGPTVPRVPDIRGHLWVSTHTCLIRFQYMA